MTNNKLRLFPLVMLITGAIDSIRNLPATALFGENLLFFYALSAITFLFPVALISAHLAAHHPKKGGVFVWANMGLGERAGFFAIWLQWINTLVWYPTILSFIAGILAYLIDPPLIGNKTYLMSVIMGTFWLLTLLNLSGIKQSARFAAACGIIGLLIPVCLILLLACLWLILGHPSYIHINLHTLLPHSHHTESWISLTAIITSFLGIELATVHINSVNNAKKTFPRALLISVILILITMVGGALAIAMVLPKNQINLVNGIMVAFKHFLCAFHLQAALPLIGGMILIGGIGGMTNWIISPAKGLLQASQHHFLPAFFQRKNRHQVAYNVLLLQALIVSIVCLAFLFMPSVNGSYWLLTDLSTELYVLMYILMFLSALFVYDKERGKQAYFSIPGGRFGFYATCIIGMLGCCIAFIVGFFPPKSINVGSTLHYELWFSGGLIGFSLPVLGFFYYQRRAKRCNPHEVV